MAERTGCPVLLNLWSYVENSYGKNTIIPCVDRAKKEVSVHLPSHINGSLSSAVA